MKNLFKEDQNLTFLLKSNYTSTKVKLFFATRAIGDEYDNLEKNYTYTDLNPMVVKCYVSTIKAESLIWKQYGLSETGAKEIIVETKKVDLFRKAHKITIDIDEYHVYRENVGNRFLITEMKLGLSKIVLSKIK